MSDLHHQQQQEGEVRRALEGLRQRFAQLAESTLKLRELLAAGGAADRLLLLGSYEQPEREQGAGSAAAAAAAANEASTALTAAYTVVATHQQAVTEQLARHHDLLASLTAFPLPSYPGQTQEEVLLQLLRKKPEVRVDDWMSGARELFIRNTKFSKEEEEREDHAGMLNGGDKAPTAKTMTVQDWHDLWTWAPTVVRPQVANYRRTALSNGDDDDNEGSSDDDDDDDDDDGAKTPPEFREDIGGESAPPGSAAAAAASTSTSASTLQQPTATAMATATATATALATPDREPGPVSLDRMLRFFHTGVLPPPPPSAREPGSASAAKPR